MTTPKKKRANRIDLTLRNLRAERKRNKLLKEIIGEHGRCIYALEQDVKMLTHIAGGLQRNKLLKEIIGEHGKCIYALEQDVKMLTHIVDGLRKPKRSKRK